jgi:hypothetical protein
MLEKRFQTDRTLDTVVDLADLAVSEFFPAGADGGIVAQAVQEEFDLVEGKSHFTGEADQEHTVECIAWIASLAASALRRGKQADFFVVTDGGGVKAGAAGEISDFHVFFLVRELRRRISLWLLEWIS